MKGRFRTIISWLKARPLLAAVPFALVLALFSLPVRWPVLATAGTAPAPMPKKRPVAPAMTAKPAPEEPQQPNASFVVKRILNIDGPFTHGTYVWDDENVPAGPLTITIDLKAQTLSVFRDGYEIGAAVILYGADDKPTPLGVFPIKEKDKDHVSNLYGAPMPYMLRLTNDGVAIHGSSVEWGSATHGCIGIPNEFAALLFAQAKIGDRVFITNGKMMQLGDTITGG